MTSPEYGDSLALLPDSAKEYLRQGFDDMLWKLMEEAASRMHTAIGPMLECDVTRVIQTQDNLSDEEMERRKTEYSESVLELHAGLNSDQAKGHLLGSLSNDLTRETSYLPSQRTKMITDKEAQCVEKRLFLHLHALALEKADYIQTHINAHFCAEFKDHVKACIIDRAFVASGKLDEIFVPRDPSLVNRIEQLDREVAGLKEKLDKVNGLLNK